MALDDLTPAQVRTACEVLLPLAEGFCERAEWGEEVVAWLRLMRELAEGELQ